jgi:biotin carboxylase
MSGKTLLVLGASAYYVRVVELLREAGYRTVVVDRNPNAPALRYADAHEIIDITDRKEVLKAATHHKVDGIMAVNDFGVRTAAYVSSTLGLIGISPSTAEMSNDKGLMRECWSRAGLRNPAFQIVTSLGEARVASREVGIPCVVKPTDCGGGGRGVSVVWREADLEWAYEFARPFAHNRRMIVEEFLDGLEMTVETISFRGAVHVLTMSDKEKPPLRTRVATALNYPAGVAASTRAEVCHLVDRAVMALGIGDGPAHTEVIVTPAGPTLVETGARGGGGHIFSTIVSIVSGINMVCETARILTGDAPDLTPKFSRGCVYRFFNPPSGILKAIYGLEMSRELPGAIEVQVTKEIGGTIRGLMNSLERCGFMVVSGRDREEAMARAKAVEKCVVFEVIPAT